MLKFDIDIESVLVAVSMENEHNRIYRLLMDIALHIDQNMELPSDDRLKDVSKLLYTVAEIAKGYHPFTPLEKWYMHDRRISAIEVLEKESIGLIA